MFKRLLFQVLFQVLLLSAFADASDLPNMKLSDTSIAELSISAGKWENSSDTSVKMGFGNLSDPKIPIEIENINGELRVKQDSHYKANYNFSDDKKNLGCCFSTPRGG